MEGCALELAPVFRTIRFSSAARIPECGHFPWEERPGELRDAVQGFLASSL
jgi:pimeloyl-ACP methyl ester carboxylesterase